MPARLSRRAAAAGSTGGTFCTCPLRSAVAGLILMPSPSAEAALSMTSLIGMARVLWMCGVVGVLADHAKAMDLGEELHAGIELNERGVPGRLPVAADERADPGIQARRGRLNRQRLTDHGADRGLRHVDRGDHVVVGQDVDLPRVLVVHPEAAAG